MALKEHRSALSDLLSTNECLKIQAHHQQTAGRDLEDIFAHQAVQPVKQGQSGTTVSTLIGRALTVMKRAVIVGTILGCLALFSCGVALSVFLLVTHWLAPAHARFQQELFFDYTKSEAVASAQFCPGLEGKGALRILKPGQRANIWLELRMPEVNGDVFQVAAALLTLQGRVIDSTSRPCLVPHRSPFLQYARMLIRLPLALVGWDTEQQTIKLPLFKKFRERADMPFCNFRAALQAHARGGEWPRLYSAVAHVDMDLGYIGQALYRVRPSGWVRRVLWAVALLAMAGSLFSLLLLWVVVSLTGTSKTQAKIGGKDKQAALSDGDVSSEDGASDVATADLDSMSETGVESVDGSDAIISPLNAQVLKKLDQKSMSQHSGGSSDGYPADGIAYINGKKFI